MAKFSQKRSAIEEHTQSSPQLKLGSFLANIPQ